jgi:hypothetical protein
MNDTINECIKRFENEIRVIGKVKENEKFFCKWLDETAEKYNDATIQELNDDILRYQKHLSNLNKIKEKLR